MSALEDLKSKANRSDKDDAHNGSSRASIFEILKNTFVHELCERTHPVI